MVVCDRAARLVCSAMAVAEPMCHSTLADEGVLSDRVLKVKVKPVPLLSLASDIDGAAERVQAQVACFVMTLSMCCKPLQEMR